MKFFLSMIKKLHQYSEHKCLFLSSASEAVIEKGYCCKQELKEIGTGCQY